MLLRYYIHCFHSRNYMESICHVIKFTFVSINVVILFAVLMFLN